MTNQSINKRFLSVTDSKTVNEVLTEVARHYDITKTEAFDEITHDKAEHLLDYLMGTMRMAISVLMRKHGLGIL